MDRDPRRSYIDILPNKFDLLPGEMENVYAYVNTGRDSVLKPNMVFENAIEGREKEVWNDYEFDVEPRRLNCTFGMNPELTFTVKTVGRKLQRAPNPLSLADTPLRFDFADRNRPSAIILTDTGRRTQLAAAQHSRTFPRPPDTGDADRSASTLAISKV